MNKIQEVKEKVDIIKVAEYLGLNLNRANKCNCIWHKENTASLSFSQSKQIFKCFGCGENGDCITLMSKVLNINALESAKQLNQIFGAGVDFGQPTSNYELNRYKQIQQSKERLKKWRNYTLQLLCDYIHSLNKIEKMQQQEIVENYIDLLIFGTEEDWLWLKKTGERWCKEIEQRIRRTNA